MLHIGHASSTQCKGINNTAFNKMLRIVITVGPRGTRAQTSVTESASVVVGEGRGMARLPPHLVMWNVSWTSVSENSSLICRWISRWQSARCHMGPKQ